MPHTEFAVAGHVVIQCPACGAAECAEPAILADAPTIVCRNCGETWPTAKRRTKRRGKSLSRRNNPARKAVEAQRRALITYSGGVDTAWAAKMDGDVLPVVVARRSRLPIGAAALASALFVTAFLGGREAAVAALPDLAGLYDSLGLPVNLDGLAIEGVQAERKLSGAAGVADIIVRGTIVNVSGEDRSVPPISAGLHAGGGARVDTRNFDPPGRTVVAGERAPFALELDEVSPDAVKVVLRFRRPAEQPARPAGATAAP